MLDRSFKICNNWNPFHNDIKSLPYGCAWYNSSKYFTLHLFDYYFVSQWWRFKHIAQQTFVLVKTSWRHLQCNIFFVFQDILKTSWRHNCKTSWRHLEDVLEDVLKMSWRSFRETYCKYVLKTSWRRLQEVLEDEKCYAEDVFKTSWRRLGKQEMFAWWR